MIPIFDLEQCLKLDEHIELAELTKNDIAQDSAKEIAKYLLENTEGSVLCLVGSSYKGVINIIVADILQKNNREVSLLPIIWEKDHIAKNLLKSSGVKTHKSVISVDLLLQNKIIVDGIFDIDDDLQNVTPSIYNVIEDVNEAKKLSKVSQETRIYVISIDIPSGIDVQTGRMIGKHAIEADATLTLQILKQGLLLDQGIQSSGNIAVLDIGLSEFTSFLKSDALLNDPSLWISDLKPPQFNSNKYTRGHVLFLGGQLAGSVKISAESARRAGAGMVTIAYLEEYEQFYTNTPEGITLIKLSGSEKEKVTQWSKIATSKNIGSIVLGCGLYANKFTQNIVLTTLEAITLNNAKLTLDGGALLAFTRNHLFQDLYKNIKKSSSDVILTPNMSEFYKMFEPYMNLKKDIIKLVEEATLITGAYIVLKGSITAISNPATPQVILNNHSSFWMSTRGVGDSLAGVIGALSTQMPTLTAISAGVWIHGDAGIESGAYMLSEDLPFFIKKTMEKLIVI